MLVKIVCKSGKNVEGTGTAGHAGSQGLTVCVKILCLKCGDTSGH